MLQTIVHLKKLWFGYYRKSCNAIQSLGEKKSISIFYGFKYEYNKQGIVKSSEFIKEVVKYVFKLSGSRERVTLQQQQKKGIKY